MMEASNATVAERGHRIADERIDHLAEWLEMSLGVSLTAFAVGAKPNDIAHFAHGEDEPDGETERRLRNLFAVTWFVATKDGPGAAYDWLVEPNPELDNRPPVRLLREGQPAEALWFAAAPTF